MSKTFLLFLTVAFDLAASLFYGGVIRAVPTDGFQPLDLRPIVNMDWKDDKEGDGKGGWTDQGDNDMHNIVPGVQTLLGVPFDLIDAAKNGDHAVLTLKSANFQAGPASAEINVNAKAASIYFLHASAWTNGQMATYVVQYDDGTSEKIPIRAGQEINDWWSPQSGAACRTALEVPNNHFDDVGLLAFGWNNPHPEKTITKLQFQSAVGQGIVILTAVTLSSKPAALPDAKDIPTPDYLRSDADTLDPTQWFPVPTTKDTFQPTCIDQLPNIDVPAGKHGFQKNVDGQWAFDDGTPCRMVCVSQNPPKSKEECAYQARLLAKYGFTMVRIGHLVSGPSEASIVDWTKPDTQHFNDKYLDVLDYYINELAKNGIYARFTTFWYRPIKAGDNVAGFADALDYAHKRAPDSIIKGLDGKEELLPTTGITFFHPDVMKMNIDFEKAFLGHRNPYRNNVAYGHDPAICQLEVTNEDGVFFYTFGAIAPVYKKILKAQYIAWLKAKYGTDDKLYQAWGEDLGGTESVEDGRVGLLDIGGTGQPDKPRRMHDQLEFYAGLEDGYFTKTRQALRDSGVKQPISGSGWVGIGNTFFTDIWANAKHMDYIDRHQYWGGGPGGWQILPGQPFETDCALKKPEVLLKLGGERVMGLPFSISEWANTLPNQFRLEAPGLMALYGNSLGGWETPIHFAWSGSYDGDETFVSLLKWMWPVDEASTLCQYPALSQMIPSRRHPARSRRVHPQSFRRQGSQRHSESGRASFVSIFPAPLRPCRRRMASTRMASLRPMPPPSDATGIGFTGAQEKPDFSLDLNKYIDLDKKEIRSATDELYWNYGVGYVTANAPRMQAAIGFLGRHSRHAQGLQHQFQQHDFLGHPHAARRQGDRRQPPSPHHRGRPHPQHGHGLQPRRSAADRNRHQPGEIGGRQRHAHAESRRFLHRDRARSVRLQDGRRAACFPSEPDRHPHGWPEQGRPIMKSNLIRRATMLHKNRATCLLFAALGLAAPVAFAIDIKMIPGGESNPVIVPQFAGKLTVDGDPAKWTNIKSLPAPWSRKPAGAVKLA